MENNLWILYVIVLSLIFLTVEEGAIGVKTHGIINSARLNQPAHLKISSKSKSKDLLLWGRGYPFIFYRK